MCVRFFLFLFVFVFVVFPVFSATNTNSGSGRVPEVKFTSWRVGRSPVGTDTSSAVQKSFITTSETECLVYVSVGYKGGNQPSGSASPIDPSTVKWEFPKSDLRKGWKLAEAPGASWSGLHPSKLSGNTSFNVLAKFSLPKYNDSTHYRISAKCSANDANRRSRSAKHRNGENMKITVKFSAKTMNGQSIGPLELKLVQDEVDQLRQEYLDLTRSIPERGSVKDVDGDFNNFGKVFYDFGHYDVMLYEGLKDKHGAWKTAMNDIYRENKPQLKQSDLEVTSAFRNPHHNDHHARETTKRATTDKHGLHQYGLALDISGKKFDIDDDGKYGDQEKMRTAAFAAKAKKAFKYTSKGHVHADWRGDGWPPSSPIPPAPKLSLPPQGTDKPLAEKKEEKLLACGHAEGSSGYHTEIPMECGEKFWYCHGDIDNVLDSHQRIACPLNASGEKCNVLGGHFYACAPHTHKYPDGTSISSPGSKFTGECGEHQVTASEASSHKAVGYACGSHSYYPCLGDPSSAETSQHLTQTLPCGSHVGRACLAAASHLSPVSCPQQDGKDCSYGSYYTCSQHTHAYPKTPVVNPVPLKPDPPKPDPKPTVQPKPDPPANTKIAGACGVHQIASSEASSHEAVKHPCGSHSYYPCQGAPSASEKNRHITQTLPCGSHVGRACLAASSHLSAVSCPQQNGKDCSYGSYYTCSVHTHAYPKTPVVNPPPKPKPDPVPKAPPKQPDPDPQVTSPCGHTHAQSESSSHTASSYPCGSHTYYPCLGSPSFAEQQRHKYQELACCVHYGYPCSASTSHTRQVTCPKKNGKACTYGYGYYYGCSPHTHKYPPSLVACGGASYTGCLGASSRTAHHVALCRSGCGNGYWTCSATAVENHETVFTCRRSGCGQTFTRCTNTPTSCVREGKPSNYHWAR